MKTNFFIIFCFFSALLSAQSENSYEENARLSTNELDGIVHLSKKQYATVLAIFKDNYANGGVRAAKYVALPRNEPNSNAQTPKAYDLDREKDKKLEAVLTPGQLQILSKTNGSRLW